MTPKRTEIPLFTKTFDFLQWLVPALNHFPKLHRHTITRRLLDATLDFQEAILEADSRRGQARRDLLQMADGHLNKVRAYLRLAHRLDWIGAGQYEHAAGMVAEMGKLLGGWQKVAS